MNRIFILSLIVALVSGFEHHRRLEKRVREGEVINCGLTKAIADMADGDDVEWCACEFKEADGSRIKGFYSPVEIDAGDQELECPPDGAIMKIKRKVADGVYQIYGEGTGEDDGCPEKGLGFIDSKSHKVKLQCVEIESYELTGDRGTEKRY